MIPNKTSFNFTEGEILLVDKPLKWTSFDVVNKLRHASKVKKIGHAGTLDPLATGLLIICIGRKATKQIDSYLGMDKEYTGSICLGATRPSYDMETDIEQSFDTSAITEAQIYAAVEKLTGTYEQTSPIFSALKIKGEPMYIKARKGLAVEGKKRTITVHTFEITNITMPYVHFRIVCSKGTYIRSIAYDLGQLLQNGGYLSSLRRTKIDKYDIDNAWQLNDLIAAIRNYNTTTGIDQNARFK